MILLLENLSSVFENTIGPEGNNVVTATIDRISFLFCIEVNQVLVFYEKCNKNLFEHK